MSKSAEVKPGREGCLRLTTKAGSVAHGRLAVARRPENFADRPSGVNWIPDYYVSQQTLAAVRVGEGADGDTGKVGHEVLQFETAVRALGELG